LPPPSLSLFSLSLSLSLYSLSHSLTHMYTRIHARTHAHRQTHKCYLPESLCPPRIHSHTHIHIHTYTHTHIHTRTYTQREACASLCKSLSLSLSPPPPTPFVFLSCTHTHAPRHESCKSTRMSTLRIHMYVCGHTMHTCIHVCIHHAYICTCLAKDQTYLVNPSQWYLQCIHIYTHMRTCVHTPRTQALTTY